LVLWKSSLSLLSLIQGFKVIRAQINDYGKQIYDQRKSFNMLIQPINNFRLLTNLLGNY
jgi:hypothetical protein